MISVVSRYEAPGTQVYGIPRCLQTTLGLESSHRDHGVTAEEMNMDPLAQPVMYPIARERGLPVWHRIEDVPGYRPHRTLGVADQGLA